MTPDRYADWMMADTVIEIRSRFIQLMQASKSLPYGTVQYQAAITDTDGNVLQFSTWQSSLGLAFFDAENLWCDMHAKYKKEAP